MADFDGLPLWDEGQVNRAGSVLYLREPARQDAEWAEGQGACVTIRKGSRAVLVKGLHSTSFDNSLLQGLDVANKALDVLSAGGAFSTMLADPGVEHIVWFDSSDSVRGRVWSAIPLALGVSHVDGVVRNAEGRDITRQEPSPEWHEAFRFFRLAQTTDDLFDAFRNLYLGLEASLSTLAPQANGEREGAWVKRALRVAETVVDLRRALPRGFEGDPVDGLFDEFYARTRNAVFHAKASTPRPGLRPEAVAPSGQFWSRILGELTVRGWSMSSPSGTAIC
jgi:hypothetical protein